jgi:molecular chaperone GrpE
LLSLIEKPSSSVYSITIWLIVNTRLREEMAVDHNGNGEAHQNNAEAEGQNEYNQSVDTVKGEDGGTSEVDAQARELAESKDRYLRLMADFENFKKRSLKEHSEILKYSGERLVVDLLEVLDNLELALAHSSAEYDKLKQGLEMVHKMFIERLGRWEIRGESSIGKDFDPQRHAAISKVPGGGSKPGTVVGELKKPYFYKDKLIRVGEVVVAAEG